MTRFAEADVIAFDEDVVFEDAECEVGGADFDARVSERKGDASFGGFATEFFTRWEEAADLY